MAVWAIGDIQGCYQEFRDLLKKIEFNEDRDQLWLAGDLVNRGPDSLSTLRYLYSIRANCVTVLGNHDLHLLAVASGQRDLGKKDTFMDVLDAPDRDQLLGWLQQQKLLHVDDVREMVLVHAGIPSIWTLDEARAYAAEVESSLRTADSAANFFAAMYGDVPDVWGRDLAGPSRLRSITNYFTRMRFSDINGVLDLKDKSGKESSRAGYSAWFNYPSRLPSNYEIVFGHWAALQGETGRDSMHAIDTGCVWGSCLTALNIESKVRVSCEC